MTSATRFSAWLGTIPKIRTAANAKAEARRMGILRSDFFSRKCSAMHFVRPGSSLPPKQDAAPQTVWERQQRRGGERVALGVVRAGAKQRSVQSYLGTEQLCLHLQV